MPWTSSGPRAYYMPGADDEESPAPMPYADDEPVPAPMPAAEDEEPRGYAAAAFGFTQGGLGVPPLRMTENGPILADNDGNPILSGGQPVTLDQYARAQASAGRGYATSAQMTPEQQRAAAGSSQRWQRPSFNPEQQQALVEHSRRQAAVSAGLPVNYGTPGGPELEPRARQQLQDAEYAVQQVRNDASLSTPQKVQAIQTLSNKINSLDPAGRYRNGQQPMSAIEKAMAQATYTDPDTGTVFAVNPKTGEIKPHFPKAQKAAAPASLLDMEPDKKYKLLVDHMEKFGITDPREAYQHLQTIDQLFRGPGGSGPGMDPRLDQRAMQGQALDSVQRFLGGDGSVSQAQAVQAYQQMHPDARWQVTDAARNVDEQMQDLERRRQNAMSSGMGFSMPDRATLGARQQRAQALLGAPVGQGVPAVPGNIPWIPKAIRDQQFKEVGAAHKEAVAAQNQKRKDQIAAARTFHSDYNAESNRYEQFDRTERDALLKLSQDPTKGNYLPEDQVEAKLAQRKAAHGYGPTHDEHMFEWAQNYPGGIPEGVRLPGNVQQRVDKRRQAVNAAAQGLMGGMAGFAGGPVGTGGPGSPAAAQAAAVPAAPASALKTNQLKYLTGLSLKAGQAKDLEASAAAMDLIRLMGQYHDISHLPDNATRQRAVANLRLLKKYDPSLTVPEE